MPFFAMQQTAAVEWINLAPGSLDILGGWLICFFTLAVFSFLYSDNPFYKLAEHVFVGMGTAYYTLEYYEQGIWQKLYEYVWGDGGAWGKLGAAGAAVEIGGLAIPPGVAVGLRIAAITLSLMLLLRLFAPNHWAPRWPLAIMVGVYAALKMTGETQSKLVLMIGGAIDSAWDPTLPGTLAEAGRLELTRGYGIFTKVVFFVGLICVLLHFVFTYRRTRALSAASKVGVVTLMITFGAMFGFTVLGRIALLIERIASLKDHSAPGFGMFGQTWLTPPYVVGALMVLLLVLGFGLRRERTRG